MSQHLKCTAITSIYLTRPMASLVAGCHAWHHVARSIQHKPRCRSHLDVGTSCLCAVHDWFRCFSVVCSNRVCACARHHLFPMKCCSGARMAKNTTVPIKGVTAKLWLRIGAFATKRKFLVIDMPEYDVVLGLDFLSKHDQIVHWHKRTMSVNVIGNNVTLHSPSATPDDGPPRWGGGAACPR